MTVTETDTETGEVLTVLEPVPLGEVISRRKREINIQHGVACIVGYLSMLAARLGGSKSFGERSPSHLKSVDMKFAEAVYHKLVMYGLQAAA